MRYFLSSDGDGHWYLIPEPRRTEWEIWQNQDFEKEDFDPDPPVGCVSLGCSYTAVTFMAPEIMGKPV